MSKLLLTIAMGVFVARLPATELVVLLDLSRSAAPTLIANKAGVRAVFASLPAPTCATVLGITNASFSRPKRLLERECIPRREYLGSAKPVEAKRRILEMWDAASPSLEAISPATDVIGALSYSALLFDQSQDEDKVLAIWSDMRQTTVGINLSEGSQISPSVLEAVRQKGLICRLPGVRVWVYGVSTQGKNPQYFSSIRDFWTGFFRQSGGLLQAFSPTSNWTGTNNGRWVWSLAGGRQ
jgi:hypothetical protein